MILDTLNVRRAQDVSVYAHQGQFRKGDRRIPYHIHPLAVADLVSDMGGDEDTVCGAFLHDVLEDVPPDRYSRVDMLGDFGEPVVKIVDAVTKDKTIQDWRESKQAQIANYIRLTDFPEALMVALGDNTHNIQSTLTRYRDIGEQFWLPFGGGKRGQIEWFRALRDEVFTEDRMPEPTRPHVEQFGGLVLQLEQMGGVSLDRREAS